MNKTAATFCFTVLIGILGICLDMILRFNGYIGIILSIATVGTFIISSLEELKKK